MTQSDPSRCLCFCAFEHNPFRRGAEGGEDGSQILKQLIYSFPEGQTDRAMEHLLSVIISFYTFTTLSLSGKKLDFLSWSNSKVAIRTIPLFDSTVLFLVLRAPAVYSDSSVSRALDHIRRGLFFVLGLENLTSVRPVRAYLEAEGMRLCRLILPPESPDPLPFSFTNLPTAEWSRAAVIATLTELSIMHKYPCVWGIVCYMNELLLVSHSPPEIIRLFDFVEPGAPRTSVFLSPDDRHALTDYKGCVAVIPEKEAIPAVLLRFQHEAVVFYLLTDPGMAQETFVQVHEMANRAMVDIAAADVERTDAKYPPNTIVYDRVLHILKSGVATPEFQANAIYAHDSFVRDPKLKDLVMHNAREFSVCMNILSVEHFAAVNGGGKGSLEEMYDEALRANPELLRYLQSLHIPPQAMAE
jgi:hypothetical protein